MAVHMATTAAVWKIEEDRVVPALTDAAANLEKAQGETVLDFSCIRRIDTQSVHALSALAQAAEEKAIKVTIRGASVGVYKVLKLVKLARRFSFAN